MNEYDENGFDKDWVHIVTGTRYDEYGFNRDGSIHEFTRLSTDSKGHKRDYYKNMESSPSNAKETIEDLFFKNDDLYILKKIHNTNLKDKKLYIKIVLLKHEIIKTDLYTGPKCMDGTPDLRYSGSYSRQIKTFLHFCIEKNSLKDEVIVDALDISYSKDKIQNTIDRYNNYLLLIQDKEIYNLYTDLNQIIKGWLDNQEEQNRLFFIRKKKKDSYEKLEKYIHSFNTEQLDKFNKFKIDIINLDCKINKIYFFEKNFKDKYKKIKLRINEVNPKVRQKRIDDEINSLFNDL